MSFNIWIDQQISYIHAMEYYSLLKRKQLLIDVRMALKIIMLKENDKKHTTLFYLYKIQKIQAML